VTNERFADPVPPDRDVTLRRRAIAEAGHTGDVPTARRGLGDEAPTVRAAAVTALERLAALDDGLLSALLHDTSPVVRRRAAEVAGGHPLVSLLDALDDPDLSVVEMAAWACGEQYEQGAAPTELLGRLATLATSHDEALVREAAVAALGSIGDEAGLPAILAATHDKAAVRRRAVIALAPFDGAEVDEALARARTDRDWQVRQAAEDLGD
jgi:HEAT repeat protein